MRWQRGVHRCEIGRARVIVQGDHQWMPAPIALDNLTPALAAAAPPGVPFDGRGRRRGDEVTLLRRGLGGRPHRRRGDGAGRSVSAPRLAAQRRVRRRRHRAVRVSRVPVRPRRSVHAHPGARCRRRRVPPKAHTRRARVGGRAVRAGVAEPRAADRADGGRARVGRSRVRGGGRCPTRCGTRAPHRWSTTSSISPTSRSCTRRPSATPTTSRCRTTRWCATVSGSRATTCTPPSCCRTRWVPTSSRWRRVARCGGTWRRSRSGCGSSTRRSTWC